MATDPDQTKAPSAFPDTRWRLVVGVRDGAADEGRAERVSELCERYWFPLHVFVRRRGLPAPDAEDTTQGIFARLIERGDQEKGRLRSYLLTAMKNYLASLRAEYASKGELAVFETLQPMLAWASGEADYSGAAVALDMTENKVRLALHRLRKRYGELMRAEIAETVAEDGEVEPELKHLMEVLRR